MKNSNKITTHELVIIPLFTAIMFAGARISIPMLPDIPFTLQLLFAVLTGLFLTPVSAGIAQFLYLILGLFGLPVFAAGGGFHYVLKPSFGYIIGFIPAAIVASILFRKFKFNGYFSSVLASFVALLVGYSVGVTYSFLLNRFYIGNEKVSFIATIASVGLLFLFDVIKVLVFAPYSVALKRVIKFGK
jgi:Uncharacterized conserved protein